MVAEDWFRAFVATPALSLYLVLCAPFGMATGFGDASMNGTIFLVNLFNPGHFLFFGIQ